MQTPLRISFHQLPPSPALEADVRARVDELEEVFERIVSCRVAIECPHRHHHQGQLYRVRVELDVPGDRIVVGRSPDRDATHEDPYVAVRDAFHAARRRLAEHAHRLRGDVKAHAGAAHGP
jgi:ribosome-associated translation inhibitor RaiA